jgi:dihydrodipicolinate reductase
MAKVTENKTVETVFLEENAALVNETTGEVIGTTSLVSTSPDQLQKAQNMFAKIKAGEFKRGVSMAAEYLEFDSIGQSVIGQYIGI